MSLKGLNPHKLDNVKQTLIHLKSLNSSAKTVYTKMSSDYVDILEDEDKLYEDVQSGACEMCGSGPLITTMKACRELGATKSKVLLYRNSGDVTGDRNQVVGYMSGMFYK